jgi:hypothetical protein
MLEILFIHYHMKAGFKWLNHVLIRNDKHTFSRKPNINKPYILQ